MITENVSTLKIHKLTQAQYDRELAAGRIDANALYLTPDEYSASNTEPGVQIPDYWKAAADAISGAIKERQEEAGAQAFQFVWFSDPHGVSDIKTSGTITSRVTNIGAVAQYVAEKHDIPFVAVSGDIMSQASYSSADPVYAEYEAIRQMFSPIDRDKLIYCKGNHDGAYYFDNNVHYLKNIGGKEIYNVMYRRQALERERVFGGDGSYFYVNDTVSKIRFIMLNGHTDGDGSIDSNGYAVYNSMKRGVYGTEQFAWLANEALDVPDGWGVVIMAHQPLDSSMDGTVLSGILKAYNNKTVYNGAANVSAGHWGEGVTDDTYTKVTASVDFTSAKGEIIAMFAGHKHQDLVYNPADYGYGCPVVVITTAGADVRGDNLNYARTVGTATETAMDIVTVDRLNKKIYCTRLGAGVDRIISYGGAVIVTYSITNSLTNCATSNSTSTIESGKPYTATIAANSGYDLSSVRVVMGGADITSTAYSSGNISIAAVTGNVVITATATVKPAESYSVTNTLTNCTTSNSAQTATAGSAYSATITAADGYTLEGATISVKMGGTDITSVAYANGIITIAGVTGPIVIIVTAVEKGPAYTNLFDVNGAGFTKQSDTKYLTNWIPYSAADNGGESTIYHLKGFANNANYTNPYKMHFAEDANGTGATELMYCTNASTLKCVAADYDSSVKLVQHKFTDNSFYHYVQFEFREALPANLIITANENIIDNLEIRNEIKYSTDASSAIYNGTGYKDGIRLGSDGADRTGAATDATGFIPCTVADTLYFKNCQIAVLGGSSTTYQAIGCYDSTKQFIKTRFVDLSTEMSGKDYDVDANGYLTRYKCSDLWTNTAYVRITGNYIGADSIITVNQPIEQ